MGSTSNYSWPTPESTDLVKDGWEAIKDLGDAADASLKTVADASGLKHIETQSFTTAASVIFNDVFTSAYDNYKAIFTGFASTTISMNVRLRASGSDASGSNYIRQRIVANSTTVSSARATGQTAYFSGDVDADPNQQIFEIGNPAKASKTTFQNFTMQNQSGDNQMFFCVGSHTLTTAYDGITFFPSSGSITGIISIYGYAKA